RAYKPRMIPQSISEMDGNGKIVLLTMGIDIGGNPMDARADYEIVAWSESGASYSIDHGSVGTFQPKEKSYVDRLKQPADISKNDNIWLDLIELMNTRFEIDNEPGVELPIISVGVDHGHMREYVESFYDYYQSLNEGPYLFMVKGHTGGEKLRLNYDAPI